MRFFYLMNDKDAIKELSMVELDDRISAAVDRDTRLRQLDDENAKPARFVFLDWYHPEKSDLENPHALWVVDTKDMYVSTLQAYRAQFPDRLDPISPGEARIIRENREQLRDEIIPMLNQDD